MENRRNSYRVLRVQPDAPIAFIRQVYRTLMQNMRMHPDLGGDTHQAALINQAYRTLTRPQDRARLDKALAASGRRHHVISVGPLLPYLKHAATARHNNINRRNYARVLSLQFDAEKALLDTARAWALQHTSNTELIQKAYAALNDSTTRERYISLLSGHSHHGALQILRDEAVEHAAQIRESVLSDPTRVCPYCQAGLIHDAEKPATECARCASPLTLPMQIEDAARRRQATRFARDTRVIVSEGFPPRRLKADLLDLSPLGVSFQCASPLETVRVARVDGNGFSAVLSVTHGTVSRSGYQYGGRFITVAFDNDAGTFFQRSA